jgi:hypothetical protein
MIRQIDVSATARKWTNVRAVLAGPTTKSATKIRLVTASGVKTLYDESPGGGGSSLVLVASPYSAGGGSKGTTVTTVPVTVSVSGGTAPYSHSWVLDASDGVASAEALSPTSATSAFRGAGVDPDGGSASFSDHVTDANGLTNSIAVSAFFNRF